MSRYIDADVIDKKVSDAYDTWTDDTAEHVVARNLLKSTRKFLLELPSIDIVRCKECKYWVQEGNESFGYAMFCNHDCSLGGQGIKNPDDFCNYGERREP